MHDLTQVLTLPKRSRCLLPELVVIKVEFFKVAQVGGICQMSHTLVHNLVAGQVKNL